MNEDKGFWLRFWGVRGSVPTSGTATMRYGGNTSCLEVGCGPHRMIFDAGTGIRGLGNVIMDEGKYCRHVFLTHTHLDHIIGFPFFRPAYSQAHNMQVWAGHLLPQGSRLRDVLDGLMQPALFPVPPNRLNGCVGLNDFAAGDVLEPFDGVKLVTAPLNHPGGATAYRIDYAGKSLCYVTDCEHIPGKLDETILGLIDNADFVIYDAMLSDEEFPKYIGWGHSTWQEGIRLCQAAGAKRLALFHHDPAREDPALDEISAALDMQMPGSFAAREGRKFHL